MDWNQIRRQVTDILQDLIRFDTSNPPGNETPCVEYIAGRLQAEGISPVVLESAPGRGNLVARLKGDGSLAPLLLMGHVDVVPADAAKWRRPPFSGDLIEGVVWGRGATDMKSMVAMELLIMLLLARDQVPLKRDVIMMATADEESGGRLGARWLASKHPDLLDAEYALNEGGATSINLGSRLFYICSTAEKGSARFTLRARGRSGHASQPRKENAILPLSKALIRLIETPLPLRVTRLGQAHIEALAQDAAHPLRQDLLNLLDPETHDRALANLPLTRPTKRRLSASLRNTAVPTLLRAGTRINVIPAEAECRVDCRILPGTTMEALEKELRVVVGDDVEIEFARMIPPLEHDWNTELFRTIRQVVAAEDKSATVVPGILTSGSDAKNVAPLGIKVHGFMPMVFEGVSMMGLAHRNDERVSVANMELGMRILYNTVLQFCSSST